ncbi:MAG: hypothetical protein WBQ08_10460 [Candidatus Sulfotelmatobacter sp.]
MSRTNHLASSAIVAVIALSSWSFLRAQEPSAPSAAPVPTRIASAKKAFISNAGEQRNSSGDLYFSGGPDRVYNQFYANMKDWGRYELVPDPADADLVLEIRLADVPQGSYNEVRLVLLDPKTHVTLWTFAEHAEYAGRQKTREASLDRALALISDDLKKLAAAPAASPGVVQK